MIDDDCPTPGDAGSPTRHAVDAVTLAFARYVERRGVMSVSELDMEDIYALPGLSHSTLNRRFGKKEAFVLQAYEQCWEDINAGLARAQLIPVELQIDAAKALEKDFKYLARRFRRLGADCRAITTCAIFLSRRADLLRRYENTVKAQAPEEVDLTGDDSKETSSQSALFAERIVSWCRLGGWKDPEVFANELIAFFLSCWIYWSMNQSDVELMDGAEDEFIERLRAKMSRPDQGPGRDDEPVTPEPMPGLGLS